MEPWQKLMITANDSTVDADIQRKYLKLTSMRNTKSVHYE